jgi:Ni,Fe-hydrogenase I cytochrome b subunit
MIEILCAVLSFVVTGLFLATWFWSEASNYENGSTSAGVYFGVGFGVGLVLLGLSIGVLIWALHSMRLSKNRLTSYASSDFNPSSIAW